MAIFNKQVLLQLAAALLLVASSSAADSGKKQFLRNGNNNNNNNKNGVERKMKKDDKSKSGTSTGTDGNLNSITTPPAPTAAPVKLAPDLNDWINGCSISSSTINGCIGGTTAQASGFNCKTCLRALSLTTSSTSPDVAGVAGCANSALCGQCSSDRVRPFYACGLKVNADFGGVTGDPNQIVVTPAPVPITTTPPAPTAAPTAAVNIDTINCPYTWPGSGTTCEMLTGFDFKKCFYYEFGANAVCGCSAVQPIWSCTGRSIVVVKEDLTTVVNP